MVSKFHTELAITNGDSNITSQNFSTKVANYYGLASGARYGFTVPYPTKLDGADNFAFCPNLFV